MKMHVHSNAFHINFVLQFQFILVLCAPGPHLEPVLKGLGRYRPGATAALFNIVTFHTSQDKLFDAPLII